MSHFHIVRDIIAMSPSAGLTVHMGTMIRRKEKGIGVVFPVLLHGTATVLESSHVVLHRFNGFGAVGSGPVQGIVIFLVVAIMNS